MGIELFRSLLASIIHKHFCCNRPTLRVETQTIRCCDKPADSLLAPRPLGIARGRAWAGPKARRCPGPWACRGGDEPSWI